jgi:ABC-type branched-subunit amino acid transport system substrate-binding protein
MNISYPLSYIYWIALSRRLVVGWLAALLATSLAVAQSNTLKVIQPMPPAGPSRAVAQELAQGAQAYLEFVNRNGGIQGKKLQLLTTEVAAAPPQAAQDIRQAVQRTQAVAVLHTMNADLNQALADDGFLLSQNIPVVGAFTSSTAIRSQSQQPLFFTRMGIRQEAQRILQHVSTIAVRRVAVVYQNEDLGRDGLRQIEDQAEAAGLSVIAAIPSKRPGTSKNETDRKLWLDRAAKFLVQSRPQTVVYFGGASELGPFLKAFQQAGGLGIPLFAGSATDATSLVQDIGASAAQGVAVVLTLPPAFSQTSRSAIEYRQIMTAHGPPGWKPSAFSFEGLINAKVLVEAIKRSGGDPTAASTYRALSATRRVDLGDFLILFKEGSREGLGYSNIGIIDRDGKLRL